MDVTLTAGKDGSLTVHRATCGKLGDRETATVDDYLVSDPGKLTTAKKASCCKPTDVVLEEIEQEAWAALEAQAEAAATEPADDTEDLIGEPATQDTGDDDEDLIGAPATTPAPAKGKTAAKVEKAKTEAKALDGLAALKKVAGHLGLELGAKPVFPGFGKAFKTPAKQSLYINSKGNADVRATDAEQAAEWAALDHVERRSGNYVRVNLAAL